MKRLAKPLEPNDEAKIICIKMKGLQTPAAHCQGAGPGLREGGAILGRRNAFLGPDMPSTSMPRIQSIRGACHPETHRCVAARAASQPPRLTPARPEQTEQSSQAFSQNTHLAACGSAATGTVLAMTSAPSRATRAVHNGTSAESFMLEPDATIVLPPAVVSKAACYYLLWMKEDAGGRETAVTPQRGRVSALPGRPPPARNPQLLRLVIAFTMAPINLFH